MNFRKGLLFAVVMGIVVLSQTNTVQAQEITNEFPLKPQYNFRTDPYLLNWTFILEDEEKQSKVAVAEASPENKILARWREKQVRLWNSLPQGPFTINASAYTAAADECGKSDGITASGLKVTEKRTLACPPNFPFGAKISIEGMGEFRCEDRGGAIKGNHVDIYMETKKEAFAFGRRNLVAEVIQ